jgi:TonB family protein
MHYLIQVNLYLIVFFAFYFFLLRKETFYQANRFYLMLSGIVSFVIPFMQTDWVQAWFVTQEVSMFMAGYDGGLLNDPITVVSSSTGLNLSLKDSLLTVYILGVLYFTFILGVNIYRTSRFVSAFDGEGNQAFSFFGKIVVGKSLKQYKAVLDHERLHVTQCHSFDVILFEVIGILCWINPLVYILKKEIKLLHEYQADSFASKSVESKAYYAALLVSQKFGVTPESFLGQAFFTKSLLRARIQMLGKEESGKRALLKYGFVAPLFLGMMVLASASIAKSDNLTKIDKISEQVTFANPLPNVSFKEVRIDLSDYSKGGIIKNLSEKDDLTLVSERESDNMPVKQQKKEEFLPPPPPSEEKASVTVTERPADEVFIGVEKHPEFVGGEAAMRHYLGQNVVYPEPATRANVSGRVTLQFIVEKDGSIGTVKVLKGIGFGCDEEAVRVIKSMPNWNPGTQNGKPVRVYFTIPVIFSLAE